MTKSSTLLTTVSLVPCFAAIPVRTHEVRHQEPSKLAGRHPQRQTPREDGAGGLPPGIRSMNAVIRTVIMATLAAATPAMAIESGSDAGPFHEQARELFEKFRAVESWSHQKRIQILQSADACLQGAQTRAAFRACEEREGVERRAHLEEVRARKQALWEEARTLQRAAWAGRARGVSREP